ncbi:FeoA family protein [Pararhodospirillum photometricum]|uniref:Ferrous iron transporter FeoA-like domain-containing protein n=1 Tax=Pararhodospirillum photometricum DSM 122 TaxID=1150469 RepID=H6SM55_PARPM|nr:FeoA family protein [Pararhodospirillum photometricum]CCG09070.1 unnamed protein product [Pararhodospirillum photometricum DSM 122]
MTHLSPQTSQGQTAPVTVRALPLGEAREGDVVRVITFRGGGRAVEELLAAGLTPGRVCSVAGMGPGGAVLVDFEGRRLAIGGNVARDIWVRLVGA